MTMSAQRVQYHAKGFSLKLVAWLISIFAVVISGLLVFSVVYISQKNEEINVSTQNYIVLKNAASDVQLASDDLTNDVRLFVTTAKKEYMDSYFVEANETRRRENAIDIIHELTEGTSIHETVHNDVTEAYNESQELMKLEFYAMKLICLDEGVSFEEYPEVANYEIDSSLPVSEYFNEAMEAVFGDEYMQSKKIIISNVDNAIKTIDDLMEKNISRSETYLRGLIIFQSIIIIINIAFIAGVVILMHIYIINPMNSAVNSLANNEEVRVKSNREFNYLADVFNRVHKANEDIKESLKYEAEHDKLTGLYNRTGYDRVFKSLKLDKTIYVLLDIDKFKEVNDTLGHEMGDKVLTRTADVIKKYFNDNNSYLCRIGGDEFAIIIDNATTDMNDVIVDKCKKMDEEISRAAGNMPGTSLSIGIAHGTIRDTTDTLFRKADSALYKIKNAGRADVSLYK